MRPSAMCAELARQGTALTEMDLRTLHTLVVKAF